MTAIRLLAALTFLAGIALLIAAGMVREGAALVACAGLAVVLCEE